MFWLLLLYFSIHLISGAAATVENRTIDDTQGDHATGARPIFLPTTQNVWQGPSCSGCAIQPEQSQAFDGTWTAATYNSGLGVMSITFNFTGTAIYIFFILANNVAPGITTETACNFTIDGSHAGFFNHTPSTSTEFQYNALVYSNDQLSNVNHQMIISTAADHNVFVSFDYAIYTIDDSSITSTSSVSLTVKPSSTSTPSSPSNSGSSIPTQDRPRVAIAAIACGVVGGVLGLLALVLALLFCRRRRKRQATKVKRISLSNPMAPAFLDGLHSAGPQSRFKLPTFISTQRNERRLTHSDFIQSGTIPTPSPLNQGSSDYDRSPTILENTTSNPADVALARDVPSTSARVAHPDTNADVLRQARQIRLQRLLALREELKAREANMRRGIRRPVKPPSSSSLRDGEDNELIRLRIQVDEMARQIEALKQQQQAGLSDEPPPGYSQS